MAVEDYIVAFSYDPLEVHTFARIVPGHPVKVVNEGLLAIRHMRIVLNVGSTCVLFDRVRGSALIEHQVVERKHVSLVTLQRFTVHLDLQATARSTLRMTPNVRIDRAPAREARRVPNSTAVGRSGWMRGWASSSCAHGQAFPWRPTRRLQT